MWCGLALGPLTGTCGFGSRYFFPDFTCFLCSRKTQSQLIREAIPYLIAPVALFGMFEYLTPFVERTIRHTPLASSNRPVDPKETAWKVELANRRAMRLHNEIEEMRVHIGVGKGFSAADGSMLDQIVTLKQQLADLKQQVDKLQPVSTPEPTTATKPDN